MIVACCGVTGRTARDPTDIEMPFTAAEAVAAGWEDPILCSPGRGRYFTKGPAGEADPYVLMYNDVDELIGIYLYSMVEQPPPWKKTESIRGDGKLPVIDFEHWGLFLFFLDTLKACESPAGPD